ncbi:MAG TPA: GAF domain-containing sensor histidine kinase [Acidimicrobiia bacterium]|nr:GAF domain-containing sensor histidine kinase [Acidimicrobiia bacterium]
MPSRHRLTALGEIIRALSRGDTPDEVVRVALEATRDAVGADVVSFAVPEANRLRFSIVEGDSFSVTTWPKDSGGLTERVLNSDEPLSIPDLMTSGIPLRRLVGEEAPHARSYVGVPARSNKRVVGVLSVQSYRPGVFGQEDVELIAEVGRQVADAIVSSRRLARIQRRISQLDRAQRERTDFLVGVAHDMRSPLAGIIGFARILEELDSVVLDPMAAEAVRFIAAEAQRLSDLVSQLVDLGRVDLGETSLDLEPVDLAKVAAQVVDVARTRFPAHRFALRVEKPVVIEGDMLRLHRVIANLVDNAAIHGPSGGLVTIEITEDAGEAVLAVSDRGPGVPPADRDRIFERFVRLDGNHAGTGIGLYLVKALVDAHGGKVTVTDAPGGGARFEVRLPEGSSREGHPVP